MSRQRSIAYLERSAAKGRPYAQYHLALQLLRSVTPQVERSVSLLKMAYAANFRPAGWALAQTTCDFHAARTALPEKAIADLLLEATYIGRNTEAAVTLCHMHGHLLSKSDRRRAFLRVAKYSASVQEALETVLKDA